MKIKPLQAFVFTLCFIFFSSMLFAQSLANQFKIGDKLPEIVIRGFLADSTKEMKIAQFYDHKLLLIDFSATWCSPCVKAWPELDSLKALFKDRLEILAVTQEKRAIVKNFLQENFGEKKLNFDFITDNKTTNPKLFFGFPHKYVPQIIWINSKGIIIACTDDFKVTKENITRAIESDQIDLPVKKDNMDFNLSTYRLKDSNAIIHSFLTPAVQGIPSSSAYFPAQNIDDVKGIQKILLTNMDVKWMYWYAAFHHTIAMSNEERLIWDMPDSSRAKYDFLYYDKINGNHTDGIEWYKRNAYCYQIETNYLKSEDQLMAHVVSDLNLGLNLYGRFEKRLVPCWLLKSKTPKIQTKGQEPMIIYQKGIVSILQNQPISKLLYYLNKSIITGQIVDDTGLKGNIDIDLTGLNGDQNTADMLNHLLAKYNLILVKSKKLLDIFVISEGIK